MNHEAAYPETSHTPEAQLFNVDAMSNEQIVVLYRGLYGIFVNETGEDEENSSTANDMLDQLEHELRELTTRDPERTKQLVADCMQSDRESDEDIASSVVRSLVHYDYTFTRDTLIAFLTDERLGPEGAIISVPRLMRDDLTPDQIDDFNAHLQARGHDPIEPAAPQR